MAPAVQALVALLVVLPGGLGLVGRAKADSAVPGAVRQTWGLPADPGHPVLVVQVRLVLVFAALVDQTCLHRAIPRQAFQAWALPS